MSKKEFYESKKAVKLGEGDVNKIAFSNKIKRNNETSKVFIGCMDDISGIVTPLCIILPQMSGCIKTKVKNFSEMIKTLFDENEIPKDKIEYVCIACISVDPVLKIDKKKLPTGFFRTM